MPPSFELFFAVPIVQVYGPNFPEHKKQLLSCFMCTAQIFLDVYVKTDQETIYYEKCFFGGFFTLPLVASLAWLYYKHCLAENRK